MLLVLRRVLRRCDKQPRIAANAVAGRCYTEALGQRHRIIMGGNAMFLIVKYLVTAGVVVVVSEVAKRSDRMGAVIAALPLVTVLTLIWLQVEKQGADKISNHAYYTFWYVLPTLPMFLLFPWLMGKMGFWLSLLTSAAITIVCFVAFAALMKKVGVSLI